MFKGRKKIIAIIICLVVMVCLPLQAFAAGPIDVDSPASIQIDYKNSDGEKIPGATFNVFKVADIDAYAKLTLTEQFEKYSAQIGDITKITGEEWNKLAETLQTFVIADSLKPLVSGVTDKDGGYIFDLSTGLYLVTGDKCEAGDSIYTAMPAIIRLPDEDIENNVWVYDITVSSKNSRESRWPDPISMKVVKVWNDNSDSSKRPSDITVNLFRDQVKIDSRKLNKENNWEYTWEKLDVVDTTSGKIYQYTVSENAVENYTVSIERKDNTVVITNTYQAPADPKLPQTGMLWWPVPVLMAAGIIVLVVGLARFRKHDAR